MPSAQFVASIRANLAFWGAHRGLADPLAWPALDRERENLFHAVVFGLKLNETWSVAAGLSLNCFDYAFERGYWSEWALVLEQAIAACPDNELAVKARLLNQLGSLYRKLRRMDDALAAHTQAQEIGVALDDHSLIALAYLNLGRVFRRRLCYDEAERFARLALTEFEATGMPLAPMAHANNLLGLIALGRGDLDDSAKELYRAVDMFRRAQEPIELGRTMVNLCETLARLDQAAEASELLEEAAAIFTKYNLQLERDRLYIALGFLHYSQNDLAQAEAAFRQAYSPSMRRAGPVYLRSQVEMNLGNVLLLQSKTDESRSYFLSAVAGFRLIGSQTMLANSLDGLAETSLAAGEKQEAIDLYEEALGIVQAIPEDAFANRMETRFRALLEELKSVPEEEE